jgi:peptide/nickel transport system substrate-binding protein
MGRSTEGIKRRGAKELSRRQVLTGTASLMAATAGLTLPGIRWAKAAQDAELRVAVPQLFAQVMNPSLLGSEGRIYAHLFEAVIRVAPGGATIPGIITKWELEPGGESWKFTVRDDVVFHDGSKLTARDVAYSYEQEVKGGDVNSGAWAGIIGKDPKIEVLDDTTLRVHTVGQQPYLSVMGSKLSSTVYILPKDYIEKVGQEGFQKKPIGTGPYQLINASPGDKMEFAAVPYKHWRVQPDFAKLTMFEVPEEATRISLLKTGEVDAIPVSLEQAQALKGQDGITILGGDTTVVALSVGGAYHPLAKDMPLGNVKVRQALSLAINRQQLIDTVFYGLGTMPAPIRTSFDDPDRGFMTAATREKWEKWAAENYRYDPAEAKRLIAEAGYPNGFTFDLWSVPDPDAPYISDIVLAAAAFFAEVGAQANVTQVDPVAFDMNKNSGKSTELVGKMYVDATSYPRTNMVDSLDRWTSKASVDLFGGSPMQDQMDKLFDSGMTQMDAGLRAQTIDQMLDVITASWTAFPVIGVPLTYAFGPRVKAEIPRPVGDWSNYYADWKYAGG